MPADLVSLFAGLTREHASHCADGIYLGHECYCGADDHNALIAARTEEARAYQLAIEREMAEEVAERDRLAGLVGKAKLIEDGDVDIRRSGSQWYMLQAAGSAVEVDGRRGWPSLDAALDALAKWRQGR